MEVWGQRQGSPGSGGGASGWGPGIPRVEAGTGELPSHPQEVLGLDYTSETSRGRGYAENIDTAQGSSRPQVTVPRAAGRQAGDEDSREEHSLSPFTPILGPHSLYLLPRPCSLDGHLSALLDRGQEA